MNQHICYATISEWESARAVREHAALRNYLSSDNQMPPRGGIISMPSYVTVLTGDPLSSEFLTQWENS